MVIQNFIIEPTGDKYFNTVSYKSELEIFALQDEDNLPGEYYR